MIQPATLEFTLQILRFIWKIHRETRETEHDLLEWRFFFSIYIYILSDRRVTEGTTKNIATEISFWTLPEENLHDKIHRPRLTTKWGGDEGFEPVLFCSGCSGWGNTCFEISWHLKHTHTIYIYTYVYICMYYNI